MKRRRGRKNNRGTLRIVACLLLASALVRVSVEAGPAVAQVGAVDVPTEENTAVTAVDEGTFLKALQDREAVLISREIKLEERIAEMMRAEVLLEEKLQELITAESALSATIAKAETASQTDISQLTTVYENMKPREAAALFEEMSPEFAAGFLGMMRPDAAASIMTLLEPEIAYSFSVVLAGRNAATPTQ